MNMEEVIAAIWELQERLDTKTDANLKEIIAGKEHPKEEITADLATQIGCFASGIEVKQEKIDTWLGETKASRKGTTACQ
jgi:fumarate hydratase class II